MFRMKLLEVVNWDYWQRMVLPLDANIVTLVGPNGSGKTTTLDALRTILHLNCSDKRDYKQYIRHNGSDFAWLRVVVSNEKQGRRGSGRPFRFLSDEVTLACRIKRSSSTWAREYAMASGNITIEDFENKESGVEWMKTRQYVSFLEGAGLTSSIRKVLSLEQGDTDKLCKYTPRALLQLVFDAFGDKECLDDYTEAREKQQEAHRELQIMHDELRTMEIQLDSLNGKCLIYREWRELTSDIAHIQSKVLPLFEVFDLQSGIKDHRMALEGSRDNLDKLDKQDKDVEATLAANRSEAGELTASLNSHKDQIKEARGDLTENREKAIAAKHKLDEKERLEGIVKKQANTDAEGLVKELAQTQTNIYENGRKLQQVNQKVDELKGQLSRINAGESIAPPYLQIMEDELKTKSVSYAVFTDIVEIINDQWRDAVEAVLSPSKHIILLDNPNDAVVAKTIGESLRYQHFIVSDRGYAENPKQGSLYSFVKFKAAPPRWLAKLLNDIQCVENAAEGEARFPNASWITGAAYYNESRGSRQISGSRHKFGAKHQARAIQDELTPLEAEVKQLEEEKASLIEKRGVILEALGGESDAPQQLVHRALEFSEARKTYDRTSAEARNLGTDVARLEGVIENIEAKINALNIEHAEIKTAAKGAKTKITEANEKISKLVIKIDDYESQLSKLSEKFSADDLSDETKDALVKQYKSGERAHATLEVKREKLADGEEENYWITDPAILIRRDKTKDDFDATKERLEAQQATLESTMQATDHAREAYIDVLRATVNKYISNLESLARIADVEIKADRPKLENTDIALAQAGLGISFNFDEKGFIDLDDGEASGGQQVIKSLILLMGLMMGTDSVADSASDKGFIFIDEPYSHLDIFNIDKVGEFLKSTGAQFIISTPITHNSNIFDPAYITLSTRKKMPGKTWADPIMHQTRREQQLVSAI